MNERSKMISRLMKGRDTRESYVRSKLSVLLPAQIRSLRLRRELTQAELGTEADMKQARISALERIGDASFSIETLIRLASAFRVGLAVRFVPMSEMLDWENDFAPDEFDVVPLENDEAFLRRERPGSQRRASSGLRAAMLGEQNDEPGRAPAYYTQNESTSLWWENSILGSILSASEASSNSTLKTEMGSATAGATLNQSTCEQGYAA